MMKEDVTSELNREPFVPLRLHLRDGRRFDVPFREVVRMLPYGVLVFLGLKAGSHQADGFDRFPFDAIDRIEQHPNGEKHKRRKAG